MSDFETYSDDDITCPYCDYKQNDSWKFPDEGEIECASCEKIFGYSRDVSVSYASTADCSLNNEEHEFGEIEDPIQSKNDECWFRIAKCNNCATWKFYDYDPETDTTTVRRSLRELNTTTEDKEQGE